MTAFGSRLRRDRPTEIAIRDSDHVCTWAEVDDGLNRISELLQATDLGPDRRVAVFAENSVETALAHIGGLIGGTSTVPVNFHLPADEVAYILADSGARVLFVDAETVERGLDAAGQVGVETVIGWACQDIDGRGRLVHWNEWLLAASGQEPSFDIPPRPHLLYTSGTTGLPKGTDLPPAMFVGGTTVAEHLELLRENRFAEFGTHLVAGPMYHTGPLSGARLLAAGIPSVVLGRFDPEKTLAAIQEYRVETSVMVPTHFVRLLSLPDDVRQRYDISSLRYVAHTGASCPVAVKQAMLDWWGPVLYEAYGATEVGTTCSIGPEDWLAHPGSVGRAVPPFEALIIDDDGRELAPNNEGMLYFRDTTGRGVVYYKDPAKSAAAHIAPGVFTLGEIAYLDEDGFVFITDRFSDMVISGGVNIYPAEAEHVLSQHPGVTDVACIGVPHAEMGEQLKALVIPSDPTAPPREEELVGYCRDRLAHYKCPRSVDLVDTVGRNSMGKLNKRQLKAPYWADV